MYLTQSNGAVDIGKDFTRIPNTDTIIIGNMCFFVGEFSAVLLLQNFSLAGDNWSVDFFVGIILGIIFLVSD